MPSQADSHRVAILGTVGVPSGYGGFETLADNLVCYHERINHPADLMVYCSAKFYEQHPETYRRARLRYIGLNANGAASILYDVVSLADAVLRRQDRILLLGVSGALALPLVRLLSRCRILTNIDGIEWKREKWKGLAKVVLKASEWAAVRFSHVVIADNQAIARYVTERYGRDCAMIPYGGDHALQAEPEQAEAAYLPADYALALCRIEPENNIHMILEAWESLERPLVFVGNWEKSAYGRELRARYDGLRHVHLLDPVYEPRTLRAIRNRAALYIHGHSAGGTNPSLVEMMHFAIPVIAHGCAFNRYSTDNRARYFETADELIEAVKGLAAEDAARIGAAMCEIARKRYTWERIGEDYWNLLG